jgi:hypothetical protein
MTEKPISIIAASVCFICLSAALPWSAEAQQTNAATFPGDEDRLDGDHLRLRTNVYGFVESGAAQGAPKKCAPQGSGLTVLQEATDGTLVVQFYDIPDSPRGVLTEEVAKEALSKCPPADRVNPYTAYQIARAALSTFGFKRSGLAFGALVVPFKFRLGGDKGITSSSTIAPYVGFRTRYLQGFGLSFTPILSAGLGLVPVTDRTENKTETRPALSLAVGLVMTSSKNEKFNAGLVFGRDVLSNSDRALDPNVDKAWLSFYLGLAI